MLKIGIANKVCSALSSFVTLSDPSPLNAFKSKCLSGVLMYAAMTDNSLGVV